MRIELNKLPWHGAVAAVLHAHKRPMRLCEIRDEILANGFSHCASDTLTAVNYALNYRAEHFRDVEKVGRGTWKRKK